MQIKKNGFTFEIENLLIIILISFFFSAKIKLFLTSYFVCYLFIAFHELSHVAVAAIFSKKLKKIKLSIAGICVVFSNDELEIVKELIIYIAGPLSNLCLAMIFNNISFIFEINIFLCVLNLMPIFPLDGYNILRILFRKIGKHKCIKYVQFTFFILLFLLSIIAIFCGKNPSLFIFFTYLMLIKYATKNQEKYR